MKKLNFGKTLSSLKKSHKNGQKSGWLLNFLNYTKIKVKNDHQFDVMKHNYGNSNSTTNDFTFYANNYQIKHNEFKNIFKNIKNDYKIIFLRGFLADLVPLYFENVFVKLFFFNFRMKKPNMDFEASIKQNAFFINNYFSKLKNKNLLVICHSKGCLDLLDATIYYPKIKKYIKGIIMMNCPIAGSIIASDLLSNNFIDDKNIIKKKTLYDLSFRGRMKFFKSNNYYDLKNLKIINYVSFSKDEKSLLIFFLNYIENNYSKKNDGLVIMNDQILPGVPTFIDIADHGNAAFNDYLITKLMFWWYKIFKV